MHSFGYRANALLTFSVTILGLMCAMASVSDNFNSPSPTANVQVLNINRFQKKSGGDDEVGMALDISANLQSLFTWNTKQVFVFLAAEYATPKNSLNQVNDDLSDFLACVLLDLHRIFMVANRKRLDGAKTPCIELKIYIFLPQYLLTMYQESIAYYVSLWDGIIPSKEHAEFSIHTTNKYRFIDQGSNLRGRNFNLTLHWHVMPKTGKMFQDKLVMTGFLLPEAYR